MSVQCEEEALGQPSVRTSVPTQMETRPATVGLLVPTQFQKPLSPPSEENSMGLLGAQKLRRYDLSPHNKVAITSFLVFICFQEMH